MRASSAHRIVGACIKATLVLALVVGCAPAPRPGDGSIFAGDAGYVVDDDEPDAGQVDVDAGPLDPRGLCSNQQTFCHGPSATGCPARMPAESSPCSLTGTCWYCPPGGDPTQYFYAECVGGAWSTSEIVCDGPGPPDAGPPDAGVSG